MIKDDRIQTKVEVIVVVFITVPGTQRSEEPVSRTTVKI